jgi:hypothetical protein
LAEQQQIVHALQHRNDEKAQTCQQLLHELVKVAHSRSPSADVC